MGRRLGALRGATAGWWSAGRCLADWHTGQILVQRAAWPTTIAYPIWRYDESATLAPVSTRAARWTSQHRGYCGQEVPPDAAVRDCTRPPTRQCALQDPDAHTHARLPDHGSMRELAGFGWSPSHWLARLALLGWRCANSGSHIRRDSLGTPRVLAPLAARKLAPGSQGSKLVCRESGAGHSGSMFEVPHSDRCRLDI